MSRFLALGDSYTIGEQVAPDECWPSQLTRVLRRHGVMLDDPELIARTGWTSGELARAMELAALTPPYELVSLSVGVNNQYRGASIDVYHQEFSELLVQSVGFTGGHAARVLVLSIPDWSVTPFAAEKTPRERETIAAEIDHFNDINRRETLAAGAHYVDVTPASRAPNPGWLAPDGLHPSAAQYAHWVSLATPAALEAFPPRA